MSIAPIALFPSQQVQFHWSSCNLKIFKILQSLTTPRGRDHHQIERRLQVHSRCFQFCLRSRSKPPFFPACSHTGASRGSCFTSSSHWRREIRFGRPTRGRPTCPPLRALPQQVLGDPVLNPSARGGFLTLFLVEISYEGPKRVECLARRARIECNRMYTV